MTNTTTEPGVDRRPLIAYLKVQRTTDRELIAILRTSSVRISAELQLLEGRVGPGAAVRREQLLLTQAYINREIAAMWLALGQRVAARKADAAAAAIESMFPVSNLKAVLPAADVDYLLRSAEASARSTSGTLAARLNLSQVPLSELVYKNRALTTGKVDQIINSAILRGASARELARDVRRFINPNTPGGVKYAAMRLGRTELNNAFHAQQVQTGISAPWVTVLQWNTSGSHPKPDECDEYANGVFIPGGEPGQWRPEDIPPKPHPNCLCFTTPITPSRSAFIESYTSGAYDVFVDDLLQAGSVTMR